MRDIPFNKLVQSRSNVRRVKAGVSVDELAGPIARRGLIRSLHVRPILGEDGAGTGMFEVPAGGRRFRALELLVKQKRLAKTAPMPCIVSEASDGVLIDEVSLAENIEYGLRQIGERIMDRDFDRQDAELQIRIALMIRLISIGTPEAVRMRRGSPRKGHVRPRSE